MLKVMYALIALAVILGVGSTAVNLYSDETKGHLEAEQLSLTFSNTQTLAERFERYRGAMSSHLQLIADAITVAPPPQTAALIEAELALLHQYADARTPEKVETIEFEIEIDNFTLGGYRLGDFASTKPLTSEFVSKTFRDYDYLIFKYKLLYDRARPSIIDPTLTTTMPVPEHPAYPSRHSSQTHLLAHIYSYLDPVNSDTYFADAAQIAENREWAGVHYPSDSAAGKSLAEQYFTESMKNEKFQHQLELLKELEWGE